MTAACYSSKLQSGQGWAQCTVLKRKDLCYEEDMKSRLSLLGVMSRHHHHHLLLKLRTGGRSKNFGVSKSLDWVQKLSLIF